MKWHPSSLGKLMTASRTKSDADTKPDAKLDTKLDVDTKPDTKITTDLPNIKDAEKVIDVISFAKCAESINIYDKIAFTDYAALLIQEYDYIFYVSPVGVDIEDNGVRETDAKYRKLIDITIKGTISENLNQIKNLAFISGTTEERIKQVKSCLGF